MIYPAWRYKRYFINKKGNWVSLLLRSVIKLVFERVWFHHNDNMRKKRWDQTVLWRQTLFRQLDLTSYSWRHRDILRIMDLDKLNLVKLGNEGLVLGSSWILLLFQLAAASKMTLASKVVKSDSKIVISLCQSKSLKHSV